MHPQGGQSGLGMRETRGIKTMKKVLFATTALVMTAGVAAAEVSLSGDGRMGMLYDGDDIQFTSRARVKFTLTGESDSGLSFGGSFRADQATDAKVGSAGSVYISGAYGKLTMGDIDSAAENAVGDLYGVGLTGLGDYNETTFIASDSEMANNPGALYEYSTGALTVYASMYDGSPYEVWSLGAKYAMDAYAFGLGYEKNGDTGVDHWVLSGEGTFDAFSVKAVYGTADDIDFDQYGLSGKYAAGATTVSAFWFRKDTAGTEFDSFGIGAEYDLGGGAMLKGGIVDSDFEADTIADFGVSFEF